MPLDAGARNRGTGEGIWVSACTKSSLLGPLWGCCGVVLPSCDLGGALVISANIIKDGGADRKPFLKMC